MGQSQSQPQQARPATPEQYIDPAERARMQAEERERRAAAAQQRFASQQKKGGSGAGARAGPAAAPKKKSALEELSAENRGWRAADEQAELRSWN